MSAPRRESESHRLPRVEGCLNIWTVYDHPSDFPDKFVARLFLYDRPTEHAIVADSVEELRAIFRNYGLIALSRQPADDLVIMETWI